VTERPGDPRRRSEHRPAREGNKSLVCLWDAQIETTLIPHLCQLVHTCVPVLVISFDTRSIRKHAWKRAARRSLDGRGGRTFTSQKAARLSPAVKE
jgi:hypothetical protein